MKLGVTAANGKLGTAILSKAIKVLGSENVIAFARSPEKCTTEGIEVREGDYHNKEHFVNGLKDIDTLILISGMDAPDDRIVAHRNVIEAAKQCGVSKIIYSSIFGTSGAEMFDAIINSNRQTEKDIQDCGIDYVIGRNGLYLEADLEAIEHYVKAGKISNCAGEGRCMYTTRIELAEVYLELAQNDTLKNKIYNLGGNSVKQSDLVNSINHIYGTNLVYEEVSVEDYKKDRLAAHGEFLGNIIAGIYVGIKNGTFDCQSDFKEIMGRKHLNMLKSIEYFRFQNPELLPK